MTDRNRACNHAVLARYADNTAALDAIERSRIEAHLDECASCRDALDEQRYVASVLRDRLTTTPEPGLVARVSARIDREAGGSWLDLANWRAWTAGLAPVAAALMIAAYLAIASTASTQTDTPTFAEWTASSTTAPAILQPAATGDALIEAVLTGSVPSGGGSDGR